MKIMKGKKEFGKDWKNKLKKQKNNHKFKWEVH